MGAALQVEGRAEERGPWKGWNCSRPDPTKPAEAADVA